MLSYILRSSIASSTGPTAVAGMVLMVSSVRNSITPTSGITLADASPSYSSPFSSSSSDTNSGTLYGRPIFPQDVYYNVKFKEALEKLRSMKRGDQVDSYTDGVLQRCGGKYMATLTLIGFKGGSLESQINQDRAIVVSPFRVGINEESDSRTKETEHSRLLGVFDGHARLGEFVSEYVVQELPKLLASKLNKLYPLFGANAEQIKKVLVDTFIELDQTCPADVSGGCTASVILQLGSKLFVANCGDSRSFLVVYRGKSQTSEIIYMSREDKPELQDEKQRIEKWGGRVFIPPFGTSRVLYTDPETSLTSGLAMSRSIGDWVVGKLGVIPDPIVDVIDVQQVVNEQMNRSNSTVDDVHIFAVSATDGLMDYVTAELVAKTLASSLYEQDGSHLMTAMEQLIYLSAAGWERAKKGTYRDDMSISVSEIRIPRT